MQQGVLSCTEPSPTAQGVEDICRRGCPCQAQRATKIQLGMRMHLLADLNSHAWVITLQRVFYSSHATFTGIIEASAIMIQLLG